MILAAAVLTAAISIEVDLVALFKGARAAETSAVTCGISTVGYRFVGKAGQKFRYAGDTYKVPVEGSIELIAAPHHLRLQRPLAAARSLAARPVRIPRSPSSLTDQLKET